VHSPHRTPQPVHPTPTRRHLATFIAQIQCHHHVARKVPPLQRYHRVRQLLPSAVPARTPPHHHHRAVHLRPASIRARFSLARRWRRRRWSSFGFGEYGNIPWPVRVVIRLANVFCGYNLFCTAIYCDSVGRRAEDYSRTAPKARALANGRDRIVTFLWRRHRRGVRLGKGRKYTVAVLLI
jgi:hypothetical protein